MLPDLRLLARAQAITWLRRRPRAKRIGLVTLFSGLFCTQWSVVALGQLLDHLLFPGFRKQPIDKPVFIIANPRSGTTWTHRLLALDEERFTWFALYQTIWPSVTWQRCFDALGRLDRRTGRRLGRVVGRLERRFFGGWDEVHKMGFQRAEEDEALFTYLLNTPALYLLFPWIDELPEAGVGDRLSPRRRRRLMRFYRGSLQRHLYANGPDKTLLTKNTHSSGRIEMLLETFPDARVVYLVRHPYAAIPSHVSMFQRVWQSHSPELPPKARASEAFAELAVAFYQKMLDIGEALGPDRFIAIRYEDLVADPRATIERITDHFGLTRSPELNARLAAATEQARSYKSQHHYSLEEFGLSREWVQARLGRLFETYELAR